MKQKEISMKRIHIAAAGVIAAFSLSHSALAQGAPMVSGTVQKIDTAQSKITIDHAPFRT
jgi:Cu(I)/Ag(I) efflux system protein CusF